MPKLLRALQVCLLLSIVFSLAIAAAETRHSLPFPRLLGTLFFALLLLAYGVVWYSIRSRIDTPGVSPTQSATTPKSGFIAGASFRGKVYLFSGGIAILLGLMVPRDKAAFLIAGAVTCCFGCYFLLIAKKFR
jgi:hypothetical protein